MSILRTRGGCNQWVQVKQAVSLIIFCGFSVDYPLHVPRQHRQLKSSVPFSLRLGSVKLLHGGGAGVCPRT